jgi:hypothetical protein
VKLKLTESQRAALDRELEATDGRWYPYTFFSRNCAYYLQALIARATEAVPPPGGIVSPTGVMDAVLKSPLAGSSYFRPGATRRLEGMSRAVPEAVRARLREDDWQSVAADTGWLRQLPAEDRHFVQEYFAWKGLAESKPLDDAAAGGVALLRVLNAQDAPVSMVPTAGRVGEPIDAPRFHQYTRLSLSVVGARAESPRVALRYRGALHDLADPSVAHRPLNSLELLSVEASIPSRGFTPRLDNVVLLSQRSLTPSDWITSRGSWMLEALGRRGGLFEPNGFHLELRGGVGKTVRLLGPTFAYALATAAGVGVCCDKIAFAPGWEAGVAWLASPRLRSGLRWSREYDISAWSRWHERLRIWTRVDVGNTWATTLSAENTPLGDLLRFSIDWYP